MLKNSSYDDVARDEPGSNIKELLRIDKLGIYLCIRELNNAWERISRGADVVIEMVGCCNSLMIEQEY